MRRCFRWPAARARASSLPSRDNLEFFGFCFLKNEIDVTVFRCRPNDPHHPPARGGLLTLSEEPKNDCAL
jgi:hypothetical protein